MSYSPENQKLITAFHDAASILGLNQNERAQSLGIDPKQSVMSVDWFISCHTDSKTRAESLIQITKDLQELVRLENEGFEAEGSDARFDVKEYIEALEGGREGFTEELSNYDRTAIQARIARAKRPFTQTLGD